MGDSASHNIQIPDQRPGGCLLCRLSQHTPPLSLTHSDMSPLASYENTKTTQNNTTKTHKTHNKNKNHRFYGFRTLFIIRARYQRIHRTCIHARVCGTGISTGDSIEGSCAAPASRRRWPNRDHVPRQSGACGDEIFALSGVLDQ